MQTWEYMWIYLDDSGGKLNYVANGQRLPAKTYVEVLNIVGKDSWELAAVCTGGRKHCHAWVAAVLP